MKVAVYSKHWGLASMMRDVLSHHDVRMVDAGHFPGEYNFTNVDGSEDVIISTMPHEDLKDYHGEKPIIIYATDPIYQWVWDDFLRVQKEPWCKVVVAEQCFPLSCFPVQPEFVIPYAINPDKYYPYTGEINKIAVVNRKPHVRWEECVRGVTGVSCPLEEFLGDIPFDIFQIPNEREYRATLGRYKAMLYFSNSPYTIVMFEAMAIGMPMVGFNQCNIHTYKPIEKYLNHYSVDRDEIQKMLKERLDSPPQTETYNVLDFNNIQKRWDNLLKAI